MKECRTPFPSPNGPKKGISLNTRFSPELGEKVSQAPILGIGDVNGEYLHLSHCCPLCHRDGRVLGKAHLGENIWAILMTCLNHENDEFWSCVGFALAELEQEVQAERVGPTFPPPAQNQHYPPTRIGGSDALTPANMVAALLTLPEGVLASSITAAQREELLSQLGLTPFWVQHNEHDEGWELRPGGQRQTVRLMAQSGQEVGQQEELILLNHRYRRAYLEA